MPYKITKNNDGSGTFKVVAKTNPSKIYAYSTKDPTALIQAIEAGFKKSRTQNKTKNTNVKSTKTPKPKRKKL